MALVFLAAHADGAFRLPKELAPATIQDKSCRGRWKLPESPWFSGRLTSARGLSLAHSHHPTGALTLLVKLSRGVEYRGPLTNWSCEHDFLWMFLGRALDTYSLHIDATFHVLAPLPVRSKDRGFSKVQVRTHNSEFDVQGMSFAKVSAIVADVAQLPVIPGAAIKQALGVTEAAWQVFVRTRPMLWIPEPVALLIGRNQWATLMCRHGWDHSHRQIGEAGQALRRHLEWPSSDWVRHVHQHSLSSRRGPTLDLPFSARHADSVVSLLRQAAPALLSSLDEELAGDKRFEFEEAVQRLLSFSSACSTAHIGNDSVVRAERLLNNLRLASYLRNRSKLRDVVVQSFRVAFPHISADRIADMARGVKVHDAGTISHCQI